MINSCLPTYYANIFLGLKCGYSDKVNDIEDVRKLCREYVEKGLCVTIQEIEYIYTGGEEPGIMIGFINYPRFPKENEEVRIDAVNFAHYLMESLHQFRCTVVTPDQTYLLENTEMPDRFEDK